MKNNKNGKVLNVLLGVIAIFIIIFVIAWVVNRGGNNSEVINQAFEKNLETMQETAKSYFANDLPSEVGDSSLISLDEMYDLDLIDKLSYGKTSCDGSSSYISVTKINKDEYKIKSNLVCGDKKDSVTEKIESDVEVEDKKGNTIVDSDKQEVIVEDENDVDPKTGGINKKTVKSKETGCVGVRCHITEIPTTCNTTYEYEFVRRSVSCPSGYVMNNGKCIKSNTDYIPATPKYSSDYTANEPAKQNPGTSYKVYIDPIVTPGKTEYYCTEGTLISGNKCVVYANKTTSTGCPSGYTKKNNYCYKYAEQSSTTTYSCPSGYTKSGSGSSTKCYKTATPTGGTTTYSCPSGYTKSGSGTSTKCYKSTSVTTTTSCPSGYSASGGSCVKTSSANVTYTAWGNPVSTYQTTSSESTYTNTYEKKVLVGTNSKKVAGKTITYYTYSIYQRSSYYTCSTGSLSGSTCYTYASATSTTSCPSGYTKSGSTCYYYTNYTTSTSASTCPSGYTKSGSTCYYYTNPTTTTTSKTCPSGYSMSGSTCYYYTNATSTTTKSCPSGYVKDGSTCYIKTDVTKSSSCPSGYTDNGSNCKKTLNAKSKTSATVYTCPTNYIKTGSGSSTKCYKNQTSSGTYYCQRANAQLVGKTCYYTVSGKLTGYTCPSGYSLNGTSCSRTTTESVSPVWSNKEYIYSTSTHLDGYQRTGTAKFKTVCTPIEEIHYK